MDWAFIRPDGMWPEGFYGHAVAIHITDLSYRFYSFTGGMWAPGQDAVLIQNGESWRCICMISYSNLLDSLEYLTLGVTLNITGNPQTAMLNYDLLPNMSEQLVQTSVWTPIDVTGVAEGHQISATISAHYGQGFNFAAFEQTDQIQYPYRVPTSGNGGGGDVTQLIKVISVTTKAEVVE